MKSSLVIVFVLFSSMAHFGVENHKSITASRHEDSCKVSLPNMLVFNCNFETAEHPNIPQMIGTKYMQFGILLLEDETGRRVDNIEHKAMNDPEKINLLILKEWLKGSGRQPVSWDTLIQVLKNIGLKELARKIDHVLKDTSHKDTPNCIGP